MAFLFNIPKELHFDLEMKYLSVLQKDFNKTFITFGFFPVDPRHPELTFVLVIDENELQKDNTKLTSIFRSVPLIYVGLVLDGRCSDHTLPLLEEMVPLCKKLFEELKMETTVQTNSKPKKIQHSHLQTW